MSKIMCEIISWFVLAVLVWYGLIKFLLEVKAEYERRHKDGRYE